MRRLLLSVLLLGAVTGGAIRAEAITRDQVMARAKAYAFHPWRCTTANLTASCSSSYKSVYVPGDYVGLPYDWGGYMTLFDFDQQIAKGFGAGSRAQEGVLSCTSGVDCSGYVSKCWDAGHYGTSTVSKVSTTIAQSSLLPGDAFNKAGSHIVLYSHTLASGLPVFYEAAAFHVEIDALGGWSKVSGFIPIRYNKITGGGAGNPVGTTQNPIVIGALPYTDSRDTSSAVSDVLDGCGAAPTKNETGPEYVYKVSFTQPGTVTVQVTDDPGADIDPHLYGSLNTSDCVARNDSVFSHPVDCGSYYIVADSFAGKVGKYTIQVSFTPTPGKACGSGPPAYNPMGELGDPCSFPGNTHTPFIYCNQQLGASICLSLGSTTSVCSKPCKAASDCQAAFPGGCCGKLTNGGSACIPAAYCGGTKLDGGVTPPKDSGGVTTDGPAPQQDATASGDSGGAAGDTTSANSETGAAGDGAPPGPGEGEDDGGCSCRTTGAGGGGSATAGLAVLLLLGLLRRRGCPL